jgi:Holliday junction resolvasome RuvABC ATP-dependent DNA helicase subunit
MKRACSLQTQTRMNIHMRVPSGLKIKLYSDENKRLACRLLKKIEDIERMHRSWGQFLKILQKYLSYI